jgi:putative transposase
VRKGSAFPVNFLKIFESLPPLLSNIMKISRDKPCYYLTSVAKDRLPVFQTDKIKTITCNALNEARDSAKILIFAYVVMPDHIHLITDSAKEISEVLRYTNGITAKRVIDYLKENNFTSSLLKLRQETKSRNYKHSLFEHHPNAFSITSEAVFMQKVNYIHQNPVRAGLVEKAENYKFSSAKIWCKNPLDDEPLEVDIDKIEWRRA